MHRHPRDIETLNFMYGLYATTRVTPGIRQMIGVDRLTATVLEKRVALEACAQ